MRDSVATWDVEITALSPRMAKKPTMSNCRLSHWRMPLTFPLMLSCPQASEYMLSFGESRSSRAHCIVPLKTMSEVRMLLTIIGKRM
jgi:hypothetical protein